MLLAYHNIDNEAHFEEKNSKKYYSFAINPSSQITHKFSTSLILVKKCKSLDMTENTFQ